MPPFLASYVGAVLGVAVAISLALRGSIAPAVVLALCAVFLIYWGRRLDRQRGER